MKRFSSVGLMLLPGALSVVACGQQGLLANCGDNVVQAEEAEQCDDGNRTAGDGCDNLCQTEEVAPVCGNNQVEAGEQCDDGNTVSGDLCDSLCQTEVGPSCGDGIIQGAQNEQCDDGNTQSGDGCSSNCQAEAEPTCGDGTLDVVLGEECDDSNRVDGDGCDNLCQIEPALPPVRSLDPTIFWVGDNADRLEEMLTELGSNSPSFDPTKPPVAVFDFDNTIIKNDIGDATMFFMINHDKILQPANQNWALTSPFLTQAARTALNAACDGLAAPGAALPTSTNTACANEIFSVYFNEKTTGNQAAFSGFNARQIEAGFAWAAQLQAGYTPAQINAIADAALTENLQGDIGATQTVGTNTVTHFIRFYDQISDLIGAMKADGFDVWIVSASPQEVVEAPAFRLGISPDHVIGIRTVVDNTGKTTANIQGCGGIPDGTNDGAGNFTGNSLITFVDGKRCWINKVIFGDNTATALQKNADPTKRQVFAAGDSDTDITFLRDATTLRLAFNRQKKELMCFAYNNFDGNWLINPTPIQPKDQRATPYPCSTNACFDSNGAGVPCFETDAAGNAVAIPDQADTVFCSGGTYCTQP